MGKLSHFMWRGDLQICTGFFALLPPYWHQFVSSLPKALLLKHSIWEEEEGFSFFVCFNCFPGYKLSCIGLFFFQEQKHNWQWGLGKIRRELWAAWLPCILNLSRGRPCLCPEVEGHWELQQNNRDFYVSLTVFAAASSSPLPPLPPQLFHVRTKYENRSHDFPSCHSQCV